MATSSLLINESHSPLTNMNSQSHQTATVSNENTPYSPTLRVALVADNSVHTRNIQKYITSSVSQCTIYRCADMLKRSLHEVTYDVIILDWSLCGSSAGKRLIGWIRKTHKSNVPVMVFSDCRSEHSVVEALYSGADNFLVRPVRQHELLAHLHALVRRAQPVYEVLACPPYTVDLLNRKVMVEDEVVKMTNLEYELTVFLFRNRGRVVSRKQLLASVWRMPNSIDTRTIDTHISKVRAKLKIPDSRHWDLTSVYRRGYRLDQQTDVI